MIKYLIKNEWLIFTTPRTLISTQMLGIQNQLFFFRDNAEKILFPFQGWSHFRRNQQRKQNRNSEMFRSPALRGSWWHHLHDSKQVSPVKSAVHMHLTPLPSATHVPPFTQGLTEQSSGVTPFWSERWEGKLNVKETQR